MDYQSSLARINKKITSRQAIKHVESKPWKKNLCQKSSGLGNMTYPPFKIELYVTKFKIFILLNHSREKGQGVDFSRLSLNTDPEIFCFIFSD